MKIKQFISLLLEAANEFLVAINLTIMDSFGLRRNKSNIGKSLRRYKNEIRALDGISYLEKLRQTIKSNPKVTTSLFDDYANSRKFFTRADSMVLKRLIFGDKIVEKNVEKDVQSFITKFRQSVSGNLSEFYRKAPAENYFALELAKLLEERGYSKEDFKVVAAKGHFADIKVDKPPIIIQYKSIKGWSLRKISKTSKEIGGKKLENVLFGPEDPNKYKIEILKKYGFYPRKLDQKIVYSKSVNEHYLLNHEQMATGHFEKRQARIHERVYFVVGGKNVLSFHRTKSPPNMIEATGMVGLYSAGGPLRALSVEEFKKIFPGRGKQ